MNSHFTAGFGNELIKEAGLRSAVKRLMSRGKDYMRRRGLAKQLGVKPADVDRVLAIQAKKARRRKMMKTMAGAATIGGLATGSMMGSRKLQQHED
jgi:hypothetical protein